MKNKIKKWHIALMSFLILFVTIFASLFSLRADTIDEETGETITDNWELGVVFYDSSVDAGKTPLTEINWDASDGSYKKGTAKVITVQINYKNSSAVTTYQPGELEIRIPNLIYSNKKKQGTAYDALWETSVLIGANDATHTGYDWTVKSSDIDHIFTNTNIIEEKSNFEGSIQIQYTITPKEETDRTYMYSFPVERYLDECIHNYSKTIQADLYSPTGDEPTVITSPNWPNRYSPATIGEELYWEHQNNNANCFMLTFDPNTTIYYNDHFSIYNKENELLYRFTSFYGKTHIIDSNYMKIGMLSTVTSYNRFSVNIIPCKKISSNILNFNYTRTYTHPWTKSNYILSKTASKISSYDGLNENPADYIWVKYNFTFRGSPTYSFNTGYAQPTEACYPYIYVNNPSFYISDELPEGCIAYYVDGTPATFEGNKCIIPRRLMTTSSYSGFTYGLLKSSIYVGYPKDKYNEELNNLNISNTAELYGQYLTDDEVSYLTNASVNINLNNFEFNYSGDLYSLSKSVKSDYNFYYQMLKEPNYKSSIDWSLSPKIRYTGSEMTVQIGDDLLYITNQNNTYEQLSYDNYYFSSVSIPSIYNSNNNMIPEGKYTLRLFVKYKDSSEYVQYGDSFQNNAYTSSYKTITFNENERVIAWYLQIDNMKEGISSFRPYSTMVFTPDKETVPESGTIYNFGYLKVYFTNNNGELVLQNECSIDNYANFITKEEIATFDISNHNKYIQRATEKKTWDYYTIQPCIRFGSIGKTATTTTQDAENERFLGSFYIGHGASSQYDPEIFNYIGSSKTPNQTLWEQINDNDFYSSIHIYDLLPKGMELLSTSEEILDSIDTDYFSAYNWSSSSIWDDVYNKKGEIAFSSNEELKNFFKERTSITITNNFEGTGQTRIDIYVSFEDNPLITFSGPHNTTGISPQKLGVKFKYDYSISYDSFLEYGNVFTNTVYGKVNDSGYYDYSADAIINSIVSTHQDVTTFVQTDKSNYSTGTVDASNNSNYEYKLRVRTGVADVTNLVIYTNLEEAQPERTRWKGEFIDINTSYAESKGYTVKPYYSENLTAGNLYNEDGTLNSDWKEYIEEEQPEIIANGLAITFDENFKTYNYNDYLYIYYYYNGYLYRSDKYYNTNLAGKTIEIPSTDIYFYWHTNSSGNSAYGFKIDNIEPKVVTEIIGATSSSLPINITTKLSGTNYPESNHDPYNDNEEKLWQYTYTDNLVLQEFVPCTDKSKVKSLAFEYLDSNGNSAIIPTNSMTYVLIRMKSPADENIKTLARMNCRTQWNALDEFDQPVDFITGINSNVVKVALPNSIDEDNLPSISLKFRKEIQGTDSEFENMKLNKTDNQIFMIRLTSLTANEDESYNQITALLKSNQELIISQIPVGTYLLEELGDNYFDFVEFADNNDPEIVINGVTFEQTDQGYIITVSESLTENVEFNIQVTNEIEPERFYEDKENKENLFLKNKIEENE